MSASADILNSKSPIPCPVCEKPFRLPEGFTINNCLACPHCQKQVSGQEILDALAPTATIVDGPADHPDPPVIDRDVKVSRPDQRRTHEIDKHDFVIPKPLKTATRQRRSRHPERKSSRRRLPVKKDASGATEFAKVAFGAILALPLAQLVLWWTFNADPLGLAEPTSKVVSFIVPPRLRPVAVVEDDEPVRNKDIPKSQKMRDDGLPKTIVPK